MKVAIVYDRVNKWGGAEQVLVNLHNIFPKAPLYTTVYDKKKAPWASVFPDVHTSFLQKISFLRDKHEFLGIFAPLAFELFDFSEFDLVISVTSEAAKGVIVKKPTQHICYCLTPTRYLWVAEKLYEKNPEGYLRFIPFYEYISRPFIWYVKKWDIAASARPDKYIAISKEVQKRIRKYYKKDSNIIYPPVDVDFYSKKTRKVRKDQFMYVGRLEAYKKVDLLINAFNKLNRRLIIIGVGTETEKLKKIANPNISFKGFVSDKKLRELYQSVSAIIMPQEEDFGIVGIESLASGTPVIAFNKGGSRDYVKDGVTGVLFNRQNEKSLIDAVKRFDTMNFNGTNLLKESRKYSKRIFKKNIVKLINSGKRQF